MRRVSMILIVLCGILLLSAPGVFGQRDSGMPTLGSYGKLPLAFTENQGQLDPQVKYVLNGPGASAFFTDDGVTLDLPGEPAGKKGFRADPRNRREQRASRAQHRRHVVLKVTFDGASSACAVKGTDPLKGKANYLAGSDPSKWQTGVPTFQGVTYKGVWDGIDVTYKGSDRRLKYDIHVRPGAAPSAIRLRYQGAESLTLDEAGRLCVKTALGTFTEEVPGIYQEKNGNRITVDGGYVLLDDRTVGFRIEGHDPTLPLVIDPVSDLKYSTFLGGGEGIDIAVDSAGCAYITGGTYSPDFPLTAGAFDTTVDYDGDAFVTKLSADGSAQVYSTFLGGGTYDQGYAIAVDSAGCAYVAGDTISSDFPTTAGSFDTNLSGGGDVFLAKLNASGTALVYAAFLGGNSEFDFCYGLAVDAAGCAYVTGDTDSANFPTTAGAYATGLAGYDDGFVTKVASDGVSLLYSTLLGGSDSDYTSAVAVDNSDYAYVTGDTFSTDFPVTPGVINSTAGLSGDSFVTKLDVDGGALIYSTLLGGSDGTTSLSIDVDNSGCAYVTGETWSTDFPVTAGVVDTTGDFMGDAFVSKLNSSGTAFVYSTFLGGSQDDLAFGIEVDSDNNAIVTGYTVSTDFPTTIGAYDRTTDGVYYYDAFLTRLNSTGTSLLYSTFLGGDSGDDVGYGLAIDFSGNAYVAGTTGSQDFPVTAGAFDTDFGTDWYDGFVAKVRVLPAAALTVSAPANQKSLWRSAKNIVRLTFDGDITAPAAGQVTVCEMLTEGTYGPDLSSGFTFTVENDGSGHPRILKIRENATSLTHRKWYAVRNTGSWMDVGSFTVQYVVQVGDSSNDGRVLNQDVSIIRTGIPTSAAADDDRRDINGDGKIINGDASIANSRIPSNTAAKPSGH